MQVFALIIEAHSDDDRLIGIYSSLEAAKAGYASYEDRSYYPCYRIEVRELDTPAAEYDREFTVFEGRFELED